MGRLTGMDVVDRLEDRVGTALDVFARSGREWGRVGANLNRSMGGDDGRQMQRVMQSTLASLEEFTRTMRAANKTLSAAHGVLGDPDTQSDLRETLDALPKLVNIIPSVIATISTPARRTG